MLSTVLSVPSLLGSCCLAGLFGWFFCSRMKFRWVAGVVHFNTSRDAICQFHLPVSMEAGRLRNED